jgi:hypothetical protein
LKKDNGAGAHGKPDGRKYRECIGDDFIRDDFISDDSDYLISDDFARDGHIRDD